MIDNTAHTRAMINKLLNWVLTGFRLMYLSIIFNSKYIMVDLVLGTGSSITTYILEN